MAFQSRENPRIRGRFHSLRDWRGALIFLPVTLTCDNGLEEEGNPLTLTTFLDLRWQVIFLHLLSEDEKGKMPSKKTFLAENLEENTSPFSMLPEMGSKHFLY